MQDRYLLKVSLCHIRYFNRILWPRIFTLVIGRLAIIVQKFELFFFLITREEKFTLEKKKSMLLEGVGKRNQIFSPSLEMFTLREVVLLQLTCLSSPGPSDLLCLPGSPSGFSPSISSSRPFLAF